ncbi:hypothetical protein Acsp01_55390 [Actinoplanes sp. NBRC 101535]|nr:hypothetical protein Acsp01_55390 [Actinoplanes sp. NBRC 101535]
MSVAGYFEWVVWKSTFDASTGKTYFTSVVAGGAGDVLGGAEEVAGSAVVALGAGTAADPAAGAEAGVLPEGCTNSGVEAVETAPPEEPQAVRQTAAAVRPERVRRNRTAPS